MPEDGYYTEAVHGPVGYLDLGSFDLASGFVLPEARLGYKTVGTLRVRMFSRSGREQGLP
jgi:homoserine acetyltransferase